jgi:hypothetical protein
LRFDGRFCKGLPSKKDDQKVGVVLKIFLDAIADKAVMITGSQEWLLGNKKINFS